MIESGGVWYPAESEVELFVVSVNDLQLAVGNRWVIQFAPTLSLPGNVLGRVEIAVEIGTLTSDGGGADLAGVEWTLLGSAVVALTGGAQTHRFAVRIDRTGEAAFEGVHTRYAQPLAFTPPAAPGLAVRARLTRFDVAEAPAHPAGALTCTLRGATHSLLQIPPAS